MFDAHCHLELYEDPEKTVSESRSKGVEGMITAGWSLESSRKAADLVHIDGVFGVIGLGPDLHREDNPIATLEDIIRKNKKIVGIGEIGLDVKAAGKISIPDQEWLFVQQLNLAQKLHMPVVIHSRGALDRVLEIIDERSVEKAMFHFFGGNEDDAKKLEKKGYLLSIPPLDSGRLRRVIRAVDTGSIVTETDAPLVGKFPYDVSKVVEDMAGLKGISPEEAGLITTQTIKDYFGIII